MDEWIIILFVVIPLFIFLLILSDDARTTYIHPKLNEEHEKSVRNRVLLFLIGGIITMLIFWLLGL